MNPWMLSDAELEWRRVLAMTEEGFRAEVISAGEDPDKVIEQFADAFKAALARAKS